MTKLSSFEKREPNEAKMIAEMTDILQRKMARDYKKGHTRRDAHPKTVGLLQASFRIEPDLPVEFKVGIFKKAQEYDCWVRLSNASGKIQSDAVKDARGLAIKLNLPKTRVAGSQAQRKQDFVLLSNPTMPLGTIAMFRDAVYYTIESSPLLMAAKLFVTGHAFALLGLLGLRINPNSPLDIRYWSTTPYLFGDKCAVKYSVKPTSKYRTEEGGATGNSYLSDAMEDHLRHNIATFDFCVQMQKNNMPIEDAGVEWDEEQSPFVKVATLHIPRQSFRTEERAELSEALSFSLENALHEHTAIGGLNRARIAIYKALSKFRHQRDGRKDIT